MVLYVTYMTHSYKPIPPADRRACRAVHSNLEDDATQDHSRGGQGLRLTSTIHTCTIHISRSTPKFHGILTLQTVVWTHSKGTARCAEGDVGRNGEEFRECCITHPDDVGQDGCDEGAREGEPGKGTT